MARRKVDPHAVPPAVTYIAAGTSFVSVASGLLFYFGASHAYWFWDYFGVSSTLLDLPAEDFLTRSVDGLFVPLVVLAGVMLVAVWLHRLLQPVLAPRYGTRSRWVAASTAAVVGVALLTVGVLNAVGIEVLEFHLSIPPLCLILGVGLLVYSSRVQRKLRMAKRFQARGALEAAGAIALIVVGLFWGVHEYSTAAGLGRAQAAHAGLGRYPNAVLYSSQNLNLPDAVGERVCSGKDTAYRYRYDGLKLVLRSGDMLVFLPDGWRRDDGAAIVMPRTTTVRFEFTAWNARAVPNDSC
jgi:hypothetical protein